MGAYISSVTEVRWSRENEHRAKVRLAAECLISPAPAWLIKILSDFSFEISTQHSIEQMSLTRKELFHSVFSAQRMAMGFIEFLTDLWTSLLPPLKGWGESRSPSWTRYFKAAEDPRLSTLRREVFRHLSIEMNHTVWRD